MSMGSDWSGEEKFEAARNGYGLVRLRMGGIDSCVEGNLGHIMLTIVAHRFRLCVCTLSSQPHDEERCSRE
jgi:hypothetical protein